MSLKSLWFDGHLDLAYLAVNRRDMLVRVDALHGDRVGPHPPASVTLAEMLDANVRLALGTIFTEAVTGNGAGALTGAGSRHTYRTGDVERAHIVARAQLEAYMTWEDAGVVALDLARVLRRDPGVGEVRGGMGVAEVAPVPIARRMGAISRDGRVHLGILMENADPIREPDELEWWAERGVIAVGMAWAPASRYAGGNATDDALSDRGRDLVDAIDSRRLIHDASHLSPASLDELLARTDRPIVASHSNPRSLLGGENNPNHRRHLSDEQIRAIVTRGGLIGINLYRGFLTHDEADHPATPERIVEHIEHVCAIAGNRDQVGIGSDMDGGFSASDLPDQILRPHHLNTIADALRAAGWSPIEVEGLRWRNWVLAIERILNTPRGVPASRGGASGGQAPEPA